MPYAANKFMIRFSNGDNISQIASVLGYKYSVFQDLIFATDLTNIDGKIYPISIWSKLLNLDIVREDSSFKRVLGRLK